MAVDRRAHIAMLSHLASRPDAELDLALAALLLCEPEYPGLDIGRYLALLDRLGELAMGALGDSADPGTRAMRLVRFLFDEVGFRGNGAEYYDPRNSFLNEVLDRKTGIPITLAIVIIEVARRVGVESAGVSFPGHFLVRATGAYGPLFFDPFEGKLLGREGLRDLHARATGEPRDPDPRLLEPAPKRQILVRMLNNLRTIYASRRDERRLREVLERLDALAPSQEVRTQLDQLGAPPPGRPRGTVLN